MNDRIVILARARHDVQLLQQPLVLQRSPEPF
jgi:hypothetical protein